MDIYTVSADKFGSQKCHSAFMAGDNERFDSLDLQHFVFFGGYNERFETCGDVYYLYTGIAFSLHLHLITKSFSLVE